MSKTTANGSGAQKCCCLTTAKSCACSSKSARGYGEQRTAAYLPTVGRHTCSEGGSGDPFGIPWNQFTEFCQSCLLQDKQHLKLKDIDTLFIATNVPSEKARVVQTVPKKSGNALARFEFLEALVRLAKVRAVTPQCSVVEGENCIGI